MNQSHIVGVSIYKGNSKLESEKFEVLLRKEIFETIKLNVSVLLQNSSYNGIQIASVQVVNDEIIRQGKHVTINTGGKHYYTDLHFSSKYLQYVHI